MKTITVNLYNFEELSDEAQKKAINDMRDIHVNYFGWDDYIIEDFVNTLETYGLTDPKVEYTGFYSQGDGLSFTSPSVDLVKLMEQSGTDKTYPNFYKYIKDQSLDYECYIDRIERHYSHENSVILRIRNLDNLLDPDEQRTLCEKLDRYLDEDYLNPEESEITELERELNRFIQRTARAMYQQLQTEYEYLSSDENIIETIEANDYLFTQDGNIY